MYYQEKKTVVTILSGILVLAAYSVYGLMKYQAVGAKLLQDTKFWATTMLIFIGAGIVLIILTQIIFHILLAVSHEVKKEIAKAGAYSARGKEIDNSDRSLEISEVEDEMDKLIALKSMRNSYILVGLGFVLSLVSMVMEMPPAVMLNVIFLSFQVGSILDGFSQLYFYKKGI